MTTLELSVLVARRRLQTGYLRRNLKLATPLVVSLKPKGCAKGGMSSAFQDPLSVEVDSCHQTHGAEEITVSCGLENLILHSKNVRRCLEREDSTRFQKSLGLLRNGCQAQIELIWSRASHWQLEIDTVRSNHLAWLWFQNRQINRSHYCLGTVLVSSPVSLICQPEVWLPEAYIGCFIDNK